MVRTAHLLAAWVLVLALVPAAYAGIDISWDACGGSAAAAGNTTFSCGDPATPRSLLGSFRSAQPLSGFVALEALLDVRVGGGLTPFWHFESAGCNGAGLQIFDSAPGGTCAATSPWGNDGARADAFIGAYQPSPSSPDRARMLLAVVRASSDPYVLEADTDYFGFRLEFNTGAAGVCAGCDAAADVVWSSAKLHSVDAGFPVQVLASPGTRSNRVMVNGGVATMSLLVVTPAVVRNLAPHELTVSAFGLVPGAAALLLRTGEPDIVGTPVQIAPDGTWLTATFDVSGARGGKWDVVVAQPGAADTLREALEILERFSLTSIAPASATNVGWAAVTVHGFGIAPGATLTLEAAGVSIITALSPVASADGTRLTAPVPLEGQPGGFRDVVVRLPDGSVSRLPNGFIVQGGGLILSTLNPSHAPDTGHVRVGVRGRGLGSGLTLHLALIGQTAIVGQNVTRTTIGDSAAATFDVRGAARGSWNLIAETGAGANFNWPAAFLVHAPASLDAITPAFAGNFGATTVLIRGTGILAGTDIDLVQGSTRIDGAESGGGDSIRVLFDLTGRPLGIYDVLAALPYGETRTMAGAFELRQGFGVTSVSPPSARNTQPVLVTVTGTGLSPGATAALQAPGVPVIAGAVSNVASDGTQLDAVFDIVGQPGGIRDVRITNVNGVSAVRPGAFTVLQFPVPVYVQPSSGFDDETLALTIRGSGFTAHAVVKLILDGQSVTGTFVSVEGDSVLTANFSLTGRAHGAYDVHIENPGLASGTLPAAFALRPRLQISSVVPARAPDDGDAQLFLTGYGFVAGTKVTLRKAGQPDRDSFAVEPLGNTLSATVSMVGAAIGHWDVRVSTPDGQSVTRPAAIRVTGAPRITAVWPILAGDDAAVAITVSGSRFADSLDLRLERDGYPLLVPSNTVRHPGDTTITGTFDLTDRPIGRWDVTARNEDDAKATLPSSFEIVPVFRLLSVAPPYGFREPDVTISVSGRWIDPGATMRLSRTGESDRAGTSPVVAGNGRLIHATFDLTGAATGSWSVIVTRPGGASATLESGLNIVDLAHAGLDLNWNACVQEPASASGVVFDCTDPATRARLFANFTPSQALPGFVALEATIDLRVGGSSLPAFWFAEGGCNMGGVVITDDRDESACPAANHATPWLDAGQAADAFITAYGPGFNGPSRARLLVTVTRASSDPVELFPFANYYGFELAFSAGAGTCDGCTTPAELSWTSATLHGNDGFSETIARGGRRSNRVGINGGLGSVLRLYDVVPASLRNDGPREFTVRGSRLVSGSSMRLIKDGEAPIVAEGEVSAVGSIMTGTFDVTDRIGGRWSMVVDNLAGEADTLFHAVELVERFRLVGVVPARGSVQSVARLTAHGFGILPGARLVLERDLPLQGFTPVVSDDGLTITANFYFSDAHAGIWDVVVVQPDGSPARLPAAFAIGTGMTVVSASPWFGVDTSSVRVTVRGIDLLPGLTLRMTRSGAADIPGTAVVVSAGGDSASGVFDLHGRPLGVWNVVVENPDSVTGTLIRGFHIVPARTIATVTPGAGDNTGSVRVQVTGQGLLGSQTAVLSRPGLPEIVGSSTVIAPSGLSLETTFDLTDAPVGLRAVVVGFGSEARASGVFEVREGIRVLGVSPRTAADSGEVRLTIAGTVFANGASATLQRHSESIAGVVDLVEPDGRTLYARFTVDGRSVGRWSIEVANPGGAIGRLDSALTLLPLPHLGAVNPASGLDRGPVELTIHGTGFAAGAGAQLRRGADSVTATSVVVTGPTAMRGTFDLVDRELGLWDLEVIQSSGLRGTLAQSFQVLPFFRVTAVTPASALDSAAVRLTISGRHIAPGASAWLARPGQADIAGTAVSVAGDGTKVEAMFDVTGRRSGVWDVVLRNSSGDADTLPGGFELRAQPHPSAVMPASGGDDRSIPITVTGSNFASDVGFELRRSTGVVIAATEVRVDGDGTSATGTVALRDQPAGLWDVLVSQVSGGSASLVQAFEVVSVPRFDAVEPASGVRGEIVTLVLFGRHIEAGATALLRRAGSPDHLPTSVATAGDGRTLTATFDLTGLEYGVSDVVLIQSGGTTTLGGVFQVRAPVPVTPLSLLWGGCNEAPSPGSEHVIFDCDDPNFSAALVANFRSPVDVSNAVGFSAVLDLTMAGGADVPPFWHLESCNSWGVTVSDARYTKRCPGSRNRTPWGPAGQFANESMGYAARFDGRHRARMLISVYRMAGDSVTIVAGQNYYAFHLTFNTDGAHRCLGCEHPVSIGFSSALIETPGTNDVVLFGAAGFPYFARINGGAGDDTPTRLLEFGAEPRDGGVDVRWQYGSGSDIVRVRLERSVAGADEWQVRHEAEGNDRASMHDRNVVPGASYDYRLVATLADGATRVSETITVKVPDDVVVSLASLTLSPNPTSGRTRIDFSLPRAAEVRIGVVDVQGRELSMIAHGHHDVGNHVVEWDGSVGGLPAKAGVYFIRFEALGHVSIRRMAIVR